MKKILLGIIAAFIAFTITACGTADKAVKDSSVKNATKQATEKANGEGFILEYPEYMKKHGESLKLDKKPEKIIALSFSAVQVFDRTTIRPIAVGQKFMAVKYPDWAKDLPVLSAGKSELDIEKIVSLKPDLVIMGEHLKEKYSEQLKASKIPVYYTSEGPIITYDETKQDVLSLAKAFGGQKVVDEINKEYAAVDDKANELKKTMKEKRAMILFSVPPKFQQSSQAYFGSMLTKLPFKLIVDDLVGANKRISPMDYEAVIKEQPEYIFCLSPSVPTEKLMKEKYAKEFADNADVWSKIDAKKNDKIIYLPNEYVTTKGLQSVKSLDKLIDRIKATIK